MKRKPQQGDPDVLECWQHGRQRVTEVFDQPLTMPDPSSVYTLECGCKMI